MARQFPSEIYQQLLGVDFRLLDELTFLAKKQAKNGRSGAAYCFPSRKYLASKLGCCVRTVSRSVARLKRLGILNAIQRRPVRGVWKTNLYRVRHWMGWRLGQIGQMLRLNRETRKASKPSCEEKESIPTILPVSRISKEPLIQKWLERGK